MNLDGLELINEIKCNLFIVERDHEKFSATEKYSSENYTKMFDAYKNSVIEHLQSYKKAIENRLSDQFKVTFAEDVVDIKSRIKKLEEVFEMSRGGNSTGQREELQKVSRPVTFDLPASSRRRVGSLDLVSPGDLGLNKIGTLFDKYPGSLIRLGESPESNLISMDFSQFRYDHASEIVGLIVAENKNLSRFNTVESITFSDCWNPDIVLSLSKFIVKNCPNLKVLTMTKWHFRDESLNVIAPGCTNLQSLNISGCSGLDNKKLNAIVQCCPSLKSLNLYMSSGVTDEGLKSIAQYCTALESLHISGLYGITDEGVKAIAAGCRSLKLLHITGSSNITDEGLKNVAQCCTALESLSVCGDSITDQSLKYIAQHCTVLESLCVRNCRVTGAGLKALAMGCLSLKSLDLSYCSITDEDLIAFAQYCNFIRMESLDLSHCSITDKGLMALAEACLYLKSLVVTGCCIRDQGLEAIALCCTALESLRISGMLITDKALTAIAQCCNFLKRLDIRTCYSITNEAVIKFRELRPACSLTR